jgi:hypothetical protein
MRKAILIFLTAFSVIILGCEKKEPLKEEMKTQPPQPEKYVEEATKTYMEPSPEELKKEESIKPSQGIKKEEAKTSSPPTVSQPEKHISRKEIRQVFPPNLIYVSSDVEDGNKNGIIEPGEIFILNVVIRNEGKGPAEGISLKVDGEGKVIPSQEEVILPDIQPGEEKNVPLRFFVPTSAPEKVTVTLIFGEGKKAEIPITIVRPPPTEKQKKVFEKKEKLEEKRKKAFEELEEETE